MNKIQYYRNRLEQLKGQKIKTEQLIESNKTQLKLQKKNLRRHEQAREIVKEVGIKTQEQLQYHISDITSLALETVFDDPYELKVEFIQRRNKTECELFFERDGNRIKPCDESGLGAVDVAAFALRIASWSINVPHPINTIILDEPFKHLKGENANLRVLDLVREISEKLKLQIIMVSDERIDREDIEEKSDKVFQVKIKNRISKIFEL